MTKREKAIKFFQDMQECTYGNSEEVDMAIHALEQERNVIEELEKVKKEILEENRFIWYPVDIKDCIDKHISELQGE